MACHEAQWFGPPASYPGGVHHVAFRTPNDEEYREWVERLIARTEKSPRFATAERRKEVVSLFQKALAWYQAAEKP